MKRQKSSRFTLIEMLVVIAIIGILASMLMPSLMKALETSRMILCTNNLRQVGMATINYSNDYNGWMLWADANVSSGLPQRDCRHGPIALRRHGYLSNDPVDSYSFESGAKSFYAYNIKYKSAHSLITACPSAEFSEIKKAGWNAWADVWDYGVRGSYFPSESPSGKFIHSSKMDMNLPYIGDTFMIESDKYRSFPSLRSNNIQRRHNNMAMMWFPDNVSRPMDEAEMLSMELKNGGTASWVSHGVSP